MTHIYIEKLKARLGQTDDLYIPVGSDPATYCNDLASSVLANVREPIRVTAVVTPPAFPDAAAGSVISAWCLASYEGYWLVYQPENDRYCCFWGEDSDHLSAPGIFGSPLYCWSA